MNRFHEFTNNEHIKKTRNKLNERMATSERLYCIINKYDAQELLLYKHETGVSK